MLLPIQAAAIWRGNDRLRQHEDLLSKKALSPQHCAVKPDCDVDDPATGHVGTEYCCGCDGHAIHCCAKHDACLCTGPGSPQAHRLK